MLIPFLVVFGLAAAAYDYTTTHNGVLETPSHAGRIQADSTYPYRGKVRTAAVRVTGTKDKYGNLHMEIEE